MDHSQVNVNFWKRNMNKIILSITILGVGFGYFGIYKPVHELKVTQEQVAMACNFDLNQDGIYGPRDLNELEKRMLDYNISTNGWAVEPNWILGPVEHTIIDGNGYEASFKSLKQAYLDYQQANCK